MTTTRLALLAIAVLLCLQGRAQESRQVRIGVFGLFHPRRLVVSPLPGQALVVSCGVEQIILDGEPGRRRGVLTIAGDQIQVSSGSTALRCSDVAIAGRSGNSTSLRLAVPGKIERQFQGTAHVSRDGSELVPVVGMDLEVAVASIVAAESPPGAAFEALKAQAMVSRSFLVSGARHAGFDFCDTTHCQFLRESPPVNSPAETAARSTSGLVLTYHGQPLVAMYSSRCGGRTAALADVGLRAEGYPYFAVRCEYCLRHPAIWQRSSMAGGEPSHPGEAARLAVNRIEGWSAIPSNNYQSRADGGEIVLTGSGSGHGVGMCQYGANGMARGGAMFPEILSHYYPNTEISRLPGR